MTLDMQIQVASSRAAWVERALIVCMVAEVLMVAAGVSQLSLLGRAELVGISDAEAVANDTQYQRASILVLVTFIVAAIAWARWQHKAYANLALVGSRETEHTPGWSVGYWFVPFLNLVRPFQIHRELWVRSSTRNAPQIAFRNVAPESFSVWWGLFIIGGLVGRLSVSLSRNASTITELENITKLDLISSFIGLATAVAAILVVRQINDAQLALAGTATEGDGIVQEQI